MTNWTAQDLKTAIMNESSGVDEDGDEYEGEEFQGWDEIAYGKSVPNPEYNEEHYAEYSRLNDEAYGVNYSIRYNERDPAKITAATDYYMDNRSTVDKRITVPFTVQLDGQELHVKVVENNGGTEGGGEQAHYVFEVGDRLFRIDGSYYSYDGTHWDEDTFREVKPVTRSVTFYE